jgi:hypothetical protein
LRDVEIVAEVTQQSGHRRSKAFATLLGTVFAAFAIWWFAFSQPGRGKAAGNARPIAEQVPKKKEQLSQPWQGNIQSGGETNPDVEDLIQRIATPWCVQLQQCGAAAIDGLSACAHTRKVLESSPVGSALSAGQCALHRDKADACARTLVALPCEELTSARLWSDFSLEGCAKNELCRAP